MYTQHQVLRIKLRSGRKSTLYSSLRTLVDKKRQLEFFHDNKE